MKLTITKEFEFDSSHRLIDKELTEIENREMFGKCYNYPSHGHLYKLFVSISGKEKNGMIINFNILKEIVNRKVIDEYDHHFLNDCPSLKGKITTCESMVKVIWALLEAEVDYLDCQLEEIKLYETPTSCAILRRCEVGNDI